MRSTESYGIWLYSIINFLQLEFKLLNVFCVIKNYIQFQKFRQIC